jgi:preprotein translocase subunit YajC
MQYKNQKSLILQHFTTTTTSALGVLLLKILTLVKSRPQKKSQTQQKNILNSFRKRRAAIWRGHPDE